MICIEYALTHSPQKNNPPTHSLTHSPDLIDQPTHSLTHILTRSLAHSLNPHTYPLTQCLYLYFSHSFTYPKNIRLLIHSLAPSLTHSTHTPTHSLNASLSNSLIYSLTPKTSTFSYTHSLTHSPDATDQPTHSQVEERCPIGIY